MLLFHKGHNYGIVGTTLFWHGGFRQEGYWSLVIGGVAASLVMGHWSMTIDRLNESVCKGTLIFILQGYPYKGCVDNKQLVA